MDDARYRGEVLHIRAYDEADRDAVVSLWKDCDLVRPWNDPGKDIDRKLRVRPDMFFVASDGDEIVGSVMAGYEGFTRGQQHGYPLHEHMA